MVGEPAHGHSPSHWIWLPIWVWVKTKQESSIYESMRYMVLLMFFGC